MMEVVTFLLLFSGALLVRIDASSVDRRLDVTIDLLNPGFHQLAFYADSTGVKCATAASDMKWSAWTIFDNPTATLFPVSNAVTSQDIDNTTHVYAQFSDGQVYVSTQSVKASGCGGFDKFRRLVQTGYLPFDSNAKLVGRDRLFVQKRQQILYVFARTQHSKSTLMQTTHRFGKVYTRWLDIGGQLLSDVSLVLNPYSGAFEAFAIFTDTKVYRTWQWKDGSWASWRTLSWGQAAMVPTIRPIAHAMDKSFFNGRSEVFAYGKDGLLHKVWQTTCDAVPNPWGYCTWSVWYKMHAKTPKPASNVNGFTVGYNIHRGIELFTVGGDGNLWHTWQLEKGAKYEDWESVGRPASGSIVSLPFVAQNEAGWWTAHVVTAGDKIESMTETRTLKVSNKTIGFGGSTSAIWSVPEDEATANDWIGIYPKSASNDKYIDFRYVQGGQNPLSKPVPQGKVYMRMFLPAGQYEVRYLVNREFTSVIHTDLISSSSSKDANWEQLFKGMLRGLGEETRMNITECVKDGEKTVADFHNAFTSFTAGKFDEGLRNIGFGLKDLYEAFMACSETEIAFKIIGFIKSLISCTSGDCGSFVVKVAEELFILYKNRYEIYGDIRAAQNAIQQIDAYEQGGMSIGRIVAACISLQDDVDKGLSYLIRPALYNRRRSLDAEQRQNRILKF
ncbi:uncharacterized protein LOC141898875 [Tubulanus polymorphus]|uniref:uncharacterized protein LOC141898875 n=1 Tax=Tubulanus polymorphus TaxID=672921 RepID=UPI003DA26294